MEIRWWRNMIWGDQPAKKCSSEVDQKHKGRTVEGQGRGRDYIEGADVGLSRCDGQWKKAFEESVC